MGQQEEKHAKKLLQKYEEQLEEAENEDNDTGFDKEELEKAEESALDDFINKHHSNFSKVKQESKLFQVICKEDNDQIIRYCTPHHKSFVEPLWSSENSKMAQDKIPACSICGAKRNYEV